MSSQASTPATAYMWGFQAVRFFFYILHYGEWKNRAGNTPAWAGTFRTLRWKGTGLIFKGLVSTGVHKVYKKPDSDLDLLNPDCN